MNDKFFHKAAASKQFLSITKNNVPIYDEIEKVHNSLWEFAQERYQKLNDLKSEIARIVGELEGRFSQEEGEEKKEDNTKNEDTSEEGGEKEKPEKDKSIRFLHALGDVLIKQRVPYIREGTKDERFATIDFSEEGYNIMLDYAERANQYLLRALQLIGKGTGAAFNVIISRNSHIFKLDNTPQDPRKTYRKITLFWSDAFWPVVKNIIQLPLSDTERRAALAREIAVFRKK